MMEQCATRVEDARMFRSRCVLALALVALAIPALASADPGALKAC